MKTKIQYLLLAFVCAAFGACQDFSDDTAFTPKTPDLKFVEQGIDADKSTKEYDLTIQSNLPWRIECDRDWVSFDPAYGPGDATIKVTVAANRTLDERTATIVAYVIQGENVTLPVKQAAASAGDLAAHYYVKADGVATNDGLSWETATTLANAIELAMNGDMIYVAAGTYVPSVPLTGMKTDLDNTFEIHSNFSMFGGYPADAVTGATADPEANETILDGSHAVCHVVTVTAAKMTGMKATLDGFTIKNGSSNFGTAASTTINGVKFYDTYGAGVYVGNTVADIVNCKIKENTDIRYGAIRVDQGAEVLFENCVVSDNATKPVANYNGGVLWTDGCELLRIDNCTFANNKTAGVGICIYIFGDKGGKSNVLISNSTISGNTVSPDADKAGGGIYVRENGNLVVVNSTIYGNNAGTGAGIAVYGSAAKPSKTVIVSSTISGNTDITANGGPGIKQVNANATIEVYNSLVAGNSQGGVEDNVLWAASNHKIGNVIIGNTVYGADGVAITGATFDAASMLGLLGENGGVTKTCVLLGDANPARQYGMTASDLQILGETLDPAFQRAISTVDQTGASREGKTVIGAIVK